MGKNSFSRVLSQLLLLVLICLLVGWIIEQPAWTLALGLDAAPDVAFLRLAQYPP